MAGGRKIKYVLLAIIIAMVALQFVPVTRDNPPVSGDFSGDPEVKQVLRQSCYDCHSHETTWPWYSGIAPVSWLVASDVEEGREKLNFSNWSALLADDKKSLKKEIWKEIEGGEMPLKIYLLLHSGAKLSETDKSVIRRWVEGGATPSETPNDTVAPDVVDE